VRVTVVFVGFYGEYGVVFSVLIVGFDYMLVNVDDGLQNNASGTLDRSSLGLRLRLIFCTMCGYGGICHTHRTTLPSSSRIPYLIVSPHQTIARTCHIAS
jgi:hypothetical protein